VEEELSGEEGEEDVVVGLRESSLISASMRLIFLYGHLFNLNWRHSLLYAKKTNEIFVSKKKNLHFVNTV